MRSTLGTHAEQRFNRGMRVWPYLLWSLCKDSLLGVVAGQAGHDGWAGQGIRMTRQGLERRSPPLSGCQVQQAQTGPRELCVLRAAC